MLYVDKLSRTPIYEQIIQQVELHIRLDEFTPENPLPSVRTLSASLGVNPNTLQKAYAELDRRGLTFSTPGSGRFVSEDAKALLDARANTRLSAFSAMAGELYQAGVSRTALIESVDNAIANSKTEDRHD
ncbi:GntR family transcriptional regulator [Christensenellaceae bacterium OttesenSCG-928-L17]|nr:GntR family transcriptional regulator [Christensenellaceae bacterium OttesenSCG-928-L17]